MGKRSNQTNICTNGKQKLTGNRRVNPAPCCLRAFTFATRPADQILTLKIGGNMVWFSRWHQGLERNQLKKTIPYLRKSGQMDK